MPVVVELQASPLSISKINLDFRLYRAINGYYYKYPRYKYASLLSLYKIVSQPVWPFFLKSPISPWSYNINQSVFTPAGSLQRYLQRHIRILVLTVMKVPTWKWSQLSKSRSPSKFVVFFQNYLTNSYKTFTHVRNYFPSYGQ